MKPVNCQHILQVWSNIECLVFNKLYFLKPNVQTVPLLLANCLPSFILVVVCHWPMSYYYNLGMSECWLGMLSRRVIFHLSVDDPFWPDVTHTKMLLSYLGVCNFICRWSTLVWSHMYTRNDIIVQVWRFQCSVHWSDETPLSDVTYTRNVLPYTVDTPNFPIGCNRLQPIGMLGVSPNFGANGSITSNTSVLLASRREIVYRL